MSATSAVAFAQQVRDQGLGHLLEEMVQRCGWSNACLFAQSCGLNHNAPKEIRFNKHVVCRLLKIGHATF